MVVKMEDGWDRVKAAAFSYSRRRRCRASRARSSPSPASCRSGFASRPPASTRAASSGSSALPWCSRGSCSGVITPYLAVKMLPKDFGKHAPRRRPVRHALLSQAARLDRLGAIERRWWVIGATAGALALALAGSKLRAAAVLPEQRASRADRRPALKEGSSFAATTEQVKKMEAVLAKDAGRALLHRVHRRRPAALLPRRSIRSCPTLATPRSSS